MPNGGGPPAGNFESTPVDAYQGALDANLLAIVAMCKAAVPAMQAQGWGRVVAITSLSVRQPMANLILSNTARAGVTSFLKTLALEVAAERRHGQHGAARAPSHAHGSKSCTAPTRRRGVADGRRRRLRCDRGVPVQRAGAFTTGVQLHVDGGAYTALL